MKCLTTVKRNLGILGIVPVPARNLPSDERRCQVLKNNIHMTFMVSSLVTYTTAVTAYLLCEANTFFEYAEEAFFCSVSVLHLSSHLIQISRRTKLFALIDEMDHIIGNSKKFLDLKSVISSGIEVSHVGKRVPQAQPTLRRWESF